MTHASRIDLPAFDTIDPAAALAQLEAQVAENLELIDRIAAAEPAWSTVVAPLEAADDAISRLWAPIRHLHAVADNEELRRAYDQPTHAHGLQRSLWPASRFA